MAIKQHKRGVLQKVGESLYRYSRNGVYYARIKRGGKETKRSLRTIDRTLAQRRLRDTPQKRGVSKSRENALYGRLIDLRPTPSVGKIVPPLTLACLGA